MNTARAVYQLILSTTPTTSTAVCTVIQDSFIYEKDTEETAHF